VLVTLYIAAITLVVPSVIGDGDETLVEFEVVADAWCKYVSFASIFWKMPLPYPSMAPCICVSVVDMYPLAATLSIHSALYLIVSLLGDAT
jgi:hypothetical protein